jgi:hypothetical protein
VAQVTALRDWQRKTGQLFVVHAENMLAYLYQDPATPIWRETSMPLADTGVVYAFNCYTTHLHFEDGVPRPPDPLNLRSTASAWTLATINGQVHSLDPDTPVTVMPDVMGNVTIINRISQFLAFGQAEALNVEAAVADYFECLKMQVKALLPNATASVQPLQTLSAQYQAQYPAGGKTFAVLNSPGGNWATYQILAGVARRRTAERK